MRFLARPKGFAEPRPRNAPLGRFCPAGRIYKLLKEGIPIRDLETIVENLMQTASETGLPPRELDQTVEKIRQLLNVPLPACTVQMDA